MTLFPFVEGSDFSVISTEASRQLARLRDGLLAQPSVIFFRDLLPVIAFSHKVENISHHDASTLEGRLAVTNLRIYYDVLSQFSPDLSHHLLLISAVWRIYHNEEDGNNDFPNISMRFTGGGEAWFCQLLQPIAKLIARDAKQFRGFGLIAAAPLDCLSHQGHLDLVESDALRR